MVVGVPGKISERRLQINPVIGIDFSKGGSQAIAFISKGKPYGKTINFYHTKDGLEEFHRFLEQIETNHGTRPDVILEATGHYHLPITDFLEEHQYVVIVLNPLISQRSRSSSLRKVKTDAYHLAELYYKEDFEPLRKRSVHITNLRQVTRINEAINDMYVQTKLNLQAIVDQVFPLFVGVFHDMYCYTSLKLLQEFSIPKSVISAEVDCIAEKILTLTSRFKSLSWAKEKVEKLMAAAQNCPTKNVYEGHLFSLHTLI
ncbi:transposase [Brevibacillus laterosporus LMG 15441]|uniref:Transposase n=1 Tax=Brevibacillus laterosporus LMG 15441 TaxID=1042163 RepID=A0A075R9A1_BRELA|nr:transposase [Brevibacillus laterosporus LMG 15441]